MTSTPRFALPFVMPAQAQKHVTVNESLERLDSAVQARVLSADIAQQPVTPEPGDSYILPSGFTGAQWSDYAQGMMVTFTEGGWTAVPRPAGMRVWISDEADLRVFDGEDWQSIGGADLGAVESLGVNAGADMTNRLTVKSDAELLSHDDVTPGSGDARKVINKAASQRTASVVFQNDWSGRAELGLIDDDDFAFKTSADGDDFKTSMVLSRSRNIAQVNHPLEVLGSPVMSVSDRPVFSAAVAAADDSYAHNTVLSLSATMDTHSAFDPNLQIYTAPMTGVYFVQLGMVIRSTSIALNFVKLRLYKNTSVAQRISAINSDPSLTTVNDAGLVSLNAGDTLNVRAQYSDASATVRFFTGSRIAIFRVI